MRMGSNVVRKQRPGSNIGLSGSDFLLAELKSAHRRMETAFTELGKEAAEDNPDAGRFSAKRMRVGQALLAKRQIVSKVASYLISVVSAEEAAAVRELRTRAHLHSQLASETIRSWSPAQIERDWSGYCAAASELTAKILSLIAAEKELLYPLMEKCAPTRAE
jgi:hypothetical protein